MLLTSLTTLTVLIFNGFVIADNECPDTWIHCGNGRCVSNIWVCDDDDDCGNMEDEKNCEHGRPIQCLSSQFTCTDGNCIPRRWECDGSKDCPDGSDETKCRNSSCSGFQCLDHHCIPAKWHCDGEEDCADGEDETGCVKDGQACNDEEFRCSAGTCLPLAKVCDGHKDCSDGEDEGSHCVDSCLNSTCAHHCKSTPKEAHCYCNEGYKLDSDHHNCSDINECLEDGFCSQKCKNLPGSYACSCLQGYTLVNRTCLAEGQEPYLVFSTSDDIRVLRLRSEMYFPIHSAVSKSTSMDVDPISSRVYWAEIGPAAIYSADISGTGFAPVVTNGLLVPEDIAVDYVAKNLYITDSRLKQVLVCKSDGSVCSPLHTTNVYSPRSLALDIPEGLLYWSDWGTIPAIYRSGMDGSVRTTLVSTNIKWPNGIAIDHTADRLYWCDASLNKIEFITLDGKIRKVILQTDVFHPYSLAVFEDHLYWSDWMTYSLESCNKFTGHKQHLEARARGKRIMGVHVYHPVLSQRGPNPCSMKMCSHLCVIGPLHSHLCLCPPGFTLLPDRKTCSMDSKSPQMFVTQETRIYHMQPEAVGNTIFTRFPISQLHNVVDLAYNWNDGVLYLSDMQKNVLEVDVRSYKKRELLSQHVGNAQSLAYDWLGRNLYWVDSDKGTVHVFSLFSGARGIVLTNLPRPLQIILGPKKGIMFLTLIDSDRPRVAMSDMDGQNMKDVSAVTGLPISIALHPDKPWLFWSDERANTISSVDYMNPAGSKKVYVRNVHHVTSISVGNKFLYWMTLLSGKVYLRSLHGNDTLVHELTVDGNSTETIIRKISYVSADHDYSPTFCKNNGGCSDICLLRPNGRTCICPIGTELSSNGTKCVVETTCSREEFRCLNNSTCIRKQYKCDGIKDCDDASDEQDCGMGSECPDGDFQCSNGRCILLSWKCDSRDDCGDGSDEKNCSLNKECSKNKFSCGSGQCIPTLWRCDGEKDCSDESDEKGCENTACKDTEHQCGQGQCIPQSWRCDGTTDCTNGSDENKEFCGTTTPACLSDDFRCNNGICVDNKLLCDHVNDCGDNSDEKGCVYNNTCKSGMFRCDDGHCIYEHEVCDGYVDCNNDETQNCSKTECSNTEFHCSNMKRCIPMSWLCDGDNDCGDGSDETLHRCHREVTTQPPPKVEKCQEFICNSKECLSWRQVCDRKPDCSDYSDEGNLCATACGTRNGGCAHLCNPMPQGPRCSCRTGYKLTSDSKTCEDENECDVPGLCSQYCNNTKGGFKCGCAEGYFLARDMRKCKADGGPATLMYLLPDQIRGYDFATHSHRVYYEQEHTDMRGVDYDAEKGYLFWSEWKEGTISRYSIMSFRNTIVVKDISRPYFIKWDWIAENIYVTTGEGNIVACSGDGEYCTEVLSSGWQIINSLDIAPQSCILFWSIWSEIRKTGLGLIERANMDGSGRITIISDKIYWPTSITTDAVLQQIFWTDIKTNVIETADYHGLNRRVILMDGMYYGFSMTIFEDYIYWTDWGTDSIIKCDKFTGQDKSIVHKGDVKAETITVVHQAKQPKGISNCKNHECLQMCLPKPNGFTCRCDQKYEFVNSTCVLRHFPRRLDPENSHPGTNRSFNSHKGHDIATEPTQTTPSVTPLALQRCENEFCKNSGLCYMVGQHKRCRCPPQHFGFYCERGTTASYDYSWVLAVFFAVVSIGLIVMVYLVCRQNRMKLSNISETFAVSFRNPRSAFRKSSGLVLDTDDCLAADDLMLQKKEYPQTGFGNPLFNKRPLMDPTPEGDYKRWPSYDSDDSAFVERHSPDETSLHIENKALGGMMQSSRDRIFRYFKRT